MTSHTAYDDDLRVVRRTRARRRALVGDAYDLHGQALFRLAHAICDDDDMAASAVVQAFAVAFAGSSHPGQEPRLPRELARLTYLACVTSQSGTPHIHPEAADATPMDVCLGGLDRQRRALLALTRYGDHTYSEAAALLNVDPTAAARALRATLRTTLRDTATVPGPHCTRTTSRS